MPVILAPEDYDVWMESEFKDSERLQALRKPYPPETTEAYPLGLAVNKLGITVLS